MKQLRTTTASLASIALLATLAACSGADAPDDPSDDKANNADTKRADPGGKQDIPSYTGLDDGQLAKPVVDEPWDLDMASGSAMEASELDGEPVLLSATRNGDVEVYGTDGEQLDSHSIHDNAIRDVHTVEIDGEMTVVTVEVEVAKVWDLASGEIADEIDMDSDYELTKIVEYDDKPVFVNAAKEVVMTDLTSMKTLHHFEYDLGLSVSHGDIVDVDGDDVLVANNSQDYGVGAWNLENGSDFHNYPMYEHENDESVSSMASGYLDDTVLAVTGDHGGGIMAWDVTANEEYGPEINPDNSTVTTLAVVELDDTLVGIAGTLDRSLVLWNVETGENIEELEVSAGINNLEVAELQGRPAVIAGGDGWAMPYWLG